MKKLAVICCAAFAALGSFSVFGTAVVPEKFAASVTFTATGYSGSETLENFPLLVKLSESIKDFKYSDCPQASIRFADADGNLIPHEVDVWDASGTSFIWVSVPALSGNTTAVKMYYGGEGADEPASSDNVWTLANFKSVWHLNIADGATSDSVASYAGALLNPNSYCGAGTGIVGGDYLNVENLVNHSIKVTNMSAFTANPAGVVTYSAWVRQVGGSSVSTKPDPENYPRIQWGSWGNCGAIWNSKNAQTSGNQGIELCLEGGKTNPQQFQRMVLRDSATTTANLNSTLSNGLYDKQWHYVVVRYDGTNRQLIIDGVTQSNFSAAGTVTTPQGIVRMGGRVDTNADCVWTGDLDEMRYRQGCTSDDWLVAETANIGAYDTFVTAVQEPMDETTIKFESAPTAVKSANGFTVSAKVIAGVGSLSVIYGTEYPFANTNQVAALVSVGETYSLELTGLTADRCYGFGVVGVGTSGVVTECLGEGGFLTGEIGIAKTSDADESHLNTPGVFTVSRPSTATADDMVVKYAVSGTAVAGTHYVALPGIVTIPAGAASATVEVYPLASYTGDHSLTLTLSEGPYGIGAGAATMTIRAFQAESGFMKKIVLTASGYTGATTLANFPLLVRLSPLINGFSYADFQLANGGDLRFATEDGVPLVHEIDTWNPEGESLVWVKVPSLIKDTKIVAYYGNVDPWAVTASDVWNDYVGVWHMNGGSGIETDATGHELVGTPTGTKLSEMVADDTAPIGAGRVNQSTTGKYNRLSVPNYNAYITDQSIFSLSGWFKMKTASGYPRPLSRKTKYDESTGWEIQYNQNSKTQFDMRGSSSTPVTTDGPDSTAGWVYLTFVFNGATGTTYANGVQKKSGTITKVASRTDAMAIGNNSNGSEQGWCGSYDEVRFYDGILSADRIAADYATVANGTFVTSENGVEPVDAGAVKFAAKPTITKSGSVFSVNVSTTADSGVGSITAYYGTDGEYDLSDVVESAATASGNYSAVLTHLDSDKSYKVSVWGENAKGTITKSKCDETLFNGEISAVKTRDADEASLANPGLFTVTRADSYGDLVVNYTTGGDAVAGTDYEELSGAVTIPDGQTSATIEVHPIRTKTVNHTLTITLTDGLYLLGSSAPTASMTIKALTTPTGYNTWIAEADGNASVAANWSEGRVPLSTDNILIDARYSNASMTWDAGENGLPATVASWTQSYSEGDAEYSGTVTFKTVYPGKGAFTCFTVTGACVINCGVWTHPISRRVDQNIADYLSDLKNNETYRLRLQCGSLSVGANARIDVKNKGYYQANSGSFTVPAASHGGRCRGSTMLPYGDPKEPIHIGLGAKPASGAYTVGIGGGAIYIVSSGTVTIDGLVRADTGSDPWNAGLTLRGCAAAGSVYVKGSQVTGTGTISANATATSEGNNRGCGGRVAVVATSGSVDRSTLKLQATVYPYKSGTTESSTYGSCGTVYVNDLTTGANGLLIIDNEASMPDSGINKSVTIPSTDGDWKFDKLALGHKAILSIPAGTSLSLPNGFTSVSSLNAADSTAYGSLRYEGGTLDVGSSVDQTMNGSWMFTGWTNFVFNGNLTVQGGAAIGVPTMAKIQDSDANSVVAARQAPAFVSSSVEVKGNLTVAATGKLVADNSGFVKRDHNYPSEYLGVLGYGTHGGRQKAKGVGEYFAPTNFYYKGYDSIFSPSLPGCSGWYGNGSSSAGGMMKFVVSGALTVNGTVTANGSPVTPRADQNNTGGPGGSIDITAGSIVGNGSIEANGGSISSTQGAGGRVAIRLTGNGADFSSFSIENIHAAGRVYSNSTSAMGTSSPGTIYMETASDGDGKGVVLIHNKIVSGYYHAANSNTTEMASLGYGGDDVKDYRRANYVVADYGRAAVNTNMTVRSLTLADVNSHLDLEGNTLTLAKFVYVTSGATCKLTAGEYSVSDLAAISGLNVYDSSSEQTGKIIVRPRGLAVLLR